MGDEQLVRSRQPFFTEVPAEPSGPLDRLLLEFRALADSTRMTGNYLEQLARHYLTVEPLWADQLRGVWRSSG